VSSANEYAIVALGLRKRFGELEAVRGVSFKVRYGEVYGFLGPNGAGKSTTVGMLITLIKPTGGEAFVAGYSVVREPVEVRRRIGVVFQDPTVDRDLTAIHNMLLHARIHGVPSRIAEERAWELLEMVGLEEHAYRPLRDYSGGMIRRFEIARSLLTNPRVVFMDEPTIGLDPHARTGVWDVIRELKRRGVTVFLTTHYMDEADKLCDRLAIIDHGRIIAEGTPSQLKSKVAGDTLYVRVEDGGVARLKRLLARYGEVKDAGNGLLVLVANDAPRLLPEIISEAQREGVRILETRYTRPSLDDVFLLLTGRRLRDEGGDWRFWGRRVARRLL